MLRTSLSLGLLAALVAAPASADDLLPRRHAADVAATAALARADAAKKKPDAAAAAAPTVDDVGDIDSFGRNVIWLGLMQGGMSLSTDCTPPAGEPADPACVTITNPAAITPFRVNDVAVFKLPARSTKTLLCHWQTPVVNYAAFNAGATPAPMRFRVTPIYRVESAVLADPSLPYGGTIELALTGISRVHTLQAGAFESDLITTTRSCIAGLLSQRNLVQAYGLTEAQARRFFREPITIRMDISGQVQNVDGASIVFGTRFTGD